MPEQSIQSVCPHSDGKAPKSRGGTPCPCSLSTPMLGSMLKKSRGSGAGNSTVAVEALQVPGKEVLLVAIAINDRRTVPVLDQDSGISIAAEKR